MGQTYEEINLDFACRKLRLQDVNLLHAAADYLRATVDLSAPIPHQLVRSQRSIDGRDSIVTYEHLARYLEQATGKFVPVLFELADTAIESRFITISGQWLTNIVREAKEYAGLATAISAPAVNEAVASAKIVNFATLPQVEQPPPPSPAQLNNLHTLLAHENSQRKAQEAAGREAIARQFAEDQVALLTAKLQASEAERREAILQRDVERERGNELERQNHILRDENEILCEELDRVAGLQAFLDVRNPLSPPDGRDIVMFWIEATQNGTVHPVRSKRRGISSLLSDWYVKRYDKAPGTNHLKYMTKACTPMDRKAGGAISGTE